MKRTILIRKLAALGFQYFNQFSESVLMVKGVWRVYVPYDETQRVQVSKSFNWPSWA